MQGESDLLKKLKDLPHEHLNATKDNEIETVPEVCCRICVDHDSETGDELISPCMCRGTQEFVHRSCLDSWRTFKAGHAFYYCTTCNAKFHLQPKLKRRGTLRKVTFYFRMARDILMLFLSLQVMIAIVSTLAAMVDREQKSNMFPMHPVIFYYCLGLLLCSVLVGLTTILEYGFVGCEIQNQIIMARVRYCCYCWGILVCIPALRVACLAIFVLVTCITGVATVVIVSAAAIQVLWDRHRDTFYQEQYKEEYVVEDLRGRYTPVP